MCPTELEYSPVYAFAEIGELETVADLNEDIAAEWKLQQETLRVGPLPAWFPLVDYMTRKGLKSAALVEPWRESAFVYKAKGSLGGKSSSCLYRYLSVYSLLLY